MFPCPEDRVCRPQFKNKGNRFDQRQQDILNTWQSEICSNDDLPEVELISLLEETIPQYKLRADTLTQFTGYENKDWYIPSPASNEDEVDTASLSKEYIRETLNYFRKYIRLENGSIKLKR
ncbi:unnamed protein product [Macrosiphum euphorbiae]|uniref:HAP1 N-terminal domain-containing protein n=1 Tax=Macrosiphum euphorbiae TaxID=13131 RepID=A0AAV0W5S7_9HEMI|nr:unnamed protein product [Macrosiphum euphorbiae]